MNKAPQKKPATAPIRDQLFETLGHLHFTLVGLLQGAELLIARAPSSWRSGDIHQALAEARLAHAYLSLFCYLDEHQADFDPTSPPFELLPDDRLAEMDSWPRYIIDALQVDRIWKAYASMVHALGEHVAVPWLPKLPQEYLYKISWALEDSLGEPIANMVASSSGEHQSGNDG
ncbi:MAG TPA: hypothetical protein VJN18_30195 [Polyangiaceae bacterium]|nr:hypothetical protein [Polyangiaceae bacterium]